MLNTRVKILRKQLNMSQEAFGLKLGVTAAGISKIESGHRNLTEQMLLLICREFQINEKWIRCGEGEMFLSQSPSDLEHIAQIYHLDELDMKIIKEYVSLDEKKRKIIKEYIMKIGNTNPSSGILSDGEIRQDVLKCAEGPNSSETGQESTYGI